MLVTLQLNPAKIELISGFIDTYLKLNTTEEQELNAELHQANLIEEERIMEIVTSWMEKGIEQGEQKIVKKLLKRRFNDITPAIESRINELSSPQIESLADAIFDLETLEDLINWLDQQR